MLSQDITDKTATRILSSELQNTYSDRKAKHKTKPRKPKTVNCQELRTTFTSLILTSTEWLLRRGSL